MDLAGAAIRHVLYPLWAVKNRSRRLRYLAELEASQFSSRDALLDHQWRQFRAVVGEAYAHCAFYRRRFQEAGISPADIRDRSDLDRIPTIAKEDVQEHGRDMISDQYSLETLHKDATGGSTGSPMQFYYTEDRLDSRVAATLRHNRWAGWEIGDRAGVLWGAPQDLRQSGRWNDRVRDWILDRRLLLDASSLTDESMAVFADELLHYQPKVLQAYSNTLALFARHLQARGIAGIRPQAIVCSAEVLTDESRALIEQTFDCRVFNRYGCREVAVIASECDRHSGLHINAENLLVEVLHDGRSVSGEVGEIVVTDLRNFAMPLIRYRIRDMGRMLDRQCECGRSLPLIELIGGRVTDFLVATDGRRVSGIVLATYVITNVAGIRQVQFVQTLAGAITIRLVRSADWDDAAAAELARQIRSYLGAEMRVEIDYCAAIPFEASGKYRFSISTLNQAC